MQAAFSSGSLGAGSPMALKQLKASTLARSLAWSQISLPCIPCYACRGTNDDKQWHQQERVVIP